MSDAFYGAIDLAGAYPVALLWGVAPPLMALRAIGRGAPNRNSNRDRRGGGMGRGPTRSPGETRASWRRVPLMALAVASGVRSRFKIAISEIAISKIS